jgi:2-polyprenyl-3-methyl-5-hydroxy-6-metoxy-1,4-benzoquinol methylase
MANAPQQFDAAEYWESRHYRFRGSSVSVGNIGLSDEDNRLQLREKTAVLKEPLLKLFPEPSTRRLLDAGCGIGIQTREFGEWGFEAVGIDFSPTAIEQARKLGGADFQVADLSAYRSDRPFDVCVCVDVLFHLVDEQRWRAVIASLAGSLLPGGYLLVTEYFAAEEPSRSPHVVWRTLDDYRAALAAVGLELQDVVGYMTSKDEFEKTLLIASKRR